MTPPVPFLERSREGRGALRVELSEDRGTFRLSRDWGDAMPLDAGELRWLVACAAPAALAALEAPRPLPGSARADANAEEAPEGALFGEPTGGGLEYAEPDPEGPTVA